MIGLRDRVACGAASHLRLKRIDGSAELADCARRMWSGFSSEIETGDIIDLAPAFAPSHVERLLI